MLSAGVVLNAKSYKSTRTRSINSAMSRIWRYAWRRLTNLYREPRDVRLPTMLAELIRFLLSLSVAIDTTDPDYLSHQQSNIRLVGNSTLTLKQASGHFVGMLISNNSNSFPSGDSWVWWARRTLVNLKFSALLIQCDNNVMLLIPSWCTWKFSLSAVINSRINSAEKSKASMHSVDNWWLLTKCTVWSSSCSGASSRTVMVK